MARIGRYGLPGGLAVVVLPVLWFVTVFGDRVGVLLDTNVSMLGLAIGGGLLAAFVATAHPLRDGTLGGGGLLALTWAVRAVYQAASGAVDVGEYGSWELYWLTSLLALVAFAILGAVLGYAGGYVVRSVRRGRSRSGS
jgi:hypothetical protein